MPAGLLLRTTSQTASAPPLPPPAHAANLRSSDDVFNDASMLCFYQRQVAAAQAALERGESGAAERLAAAEEELERALEAVLDAECAGGGGFGGKSVLKRASHVHALYFLLGMTRLSWAIGQLKGQSMTRSTRAKTQARMLRGGFGCCDHEAG